MSDASLHEELSETKRDLLVTRLWLAFTVFAMLAFTFLGFAPIADERNALRRQLTASNATEHTLRRKIAASDATERALRLEITAHERIEVDLRNQLAATNELLRNTQRVLELEGDAVARLTVERDAARIGFRLRGMAMP